jgi:hypothetical protein
MAEFVQPKHLSLSRSMRVPAGVTANIWALSRRLNWDNVKEKENPTILEDEISFVRRPRDSHTIFELAELEEMIRGFELQVGETLCTATFLPNEEPVNCNCNGLDDVFMANIDDLPYVNAATAEPRDVGK